MDLHVKNRKIKTENVLKIYLVTYYPNNVLFPISESWTSVQRVWIVSLRSSICLDLVLIMLLAPVYVGYIASFFFPSVVGTKITKQLARNDIFNIWNTHTSSKLEHKYLFPEFCKKNLYDAVM